MNKCKRCGHDVYRNFAHYDLKTGNHYCDNCYGRRNEKPSYCVMCGVEFDPIMSGYFCYCRKCTGLYRDKQNLFIKSVNCPTCEEPMDYYLLSGEYDHYECETCGYSECL